MRRKYQTYPGRFLFLLFVWIFAGAGSCHRTEGQEACESVVDDQERTLVSEGMLTVSKQDKDSVVYQVGDLKLMPAPNSSAFTMLSLQQRKEISVWISYHHKGKVLFAGILWPQKSEETHGRYWIDISKVALVPANLCVAEILRDHAEKPVIVSFTPRPTT